MHWLDKYIEEQKEQKDLINSICDPYDPAELQEITEMIINNTGEPIPKLYLIGHLEIGGMSDAD